MSVLQRHSEPRLIDGGASGAHRDRIQPRETFGPPPPARLPAAEPTFDVHSNPHKHPIGNLPRPPLRVPRGHHADLSLHQHRLRPRPRLGDPLNPQIRNPIRRHLPPIQARSRVEPILLHPTPDPNPNNKLHPNLPLPPPKILHPNPNPNPWPAHPFHPPQHPYHPRPNHDQISPN